MLVNIELLIEILDIASPIRDKLERNENVIKILKKFNLDPEHLSSQNNFLNFKIYSLWHIYSDSVTSIAYVLEITC